MARTWSTEVTFGRVVTKPAGGPPPKAPSTRSSERTPRRRVGASSDLMRTPLTNGAPAPPSPARTSPASRACRSSSSSGRGAVAVLEVQPQVLDRLARQLGQHPRPHLVDHRGGQPGDPRHRPGVLGGHRVQRVGADAGHDVGGGPVGRQVQRVHRLPAGRLSGPARGQRRIGGGEQVVQLAQDVVGQGHPVASHRSRSAARPSSVGLPHSRSRAIPPSG